MAQNSTLDFTDGLVSAPPAAATSAPATVTSSFTDGLVANTPPAAPAAPPSTGGSDQPDSTLQNVLAKTGEVGAGVATGFVKGMGDTVSGVSHLIHKIPVVGETLAPEAGITSLDQRDVANGTAEMAGKGLEGIAEFATGDEALEGLSKATKLVALAKKYPAIAEVLNMAKSDKTLAKLITGGAKAAAVGGTQGLVKGAQKDNAVEGAAVGAGTAGVTTGLTEAAPEIFNWMTRTAGLGGHTYNEAMTMAGRPNVNEGQKFAAALDGAKDILATIPNKTVKTVGDFEDAVHDKADQLWQTQVMPLVDKHKNEVIDGVPIAAKVRQVLDDNEGMRDMFPSEAKEIERMAGVFDQSKLSLDKANGYLRTLNAKLKTYYKMSPDLRAAKDITDGGLAGMEAAADGLRDQIYTKIDQGENLPPGTTATLRRQYGQLKDVERVFGKRAVVTDRQAPLNVTQVLGMAAGAGRILAGDMTGAAEIAVPFITKARTSAKSLIKQGLNDAREQAGNPALGDRIQSAVGTASKAAPAVATQAANAAIPQGVPEPPTGFITIQDSRGGVHQVPEGALSDLQQRDPGLKIIGGK